MDNREILHTLERLVTIQRTIRHGAADPCFAIALSVFRAYYQKLPDAIVRRLSEISPQAVEAVIDATAADSTLEMQQSVARHLAGDAAYAQLLRAVNVYRRKLGLSSNQEGGFL